MKKQLIIGGLLPITLGGLIYIMFRTNNLVMFKWFSKLSLNSIIYSIRNLSILKIIHLPEWFLFSLPDGFYMFSFVSILLLLWNNVFNKQSFLWIFSIPLMGIVSELLQYTGLFPGTFDSIDVLFYTLGAILPLFLFRKSKNKLTTNKSIVYKQLMSLFIIVLFIYIAFGADTIKSYSSNSYALKKIFGITYTIK